MENSNDFKLILESLQSAQNDIRSKAEETYESISARNKLYLLMNIISDRSNIQQNRIFSGVLCRRLLDVSYDEAFESIPKENQESIKHEILKLIITENDTNVRKKLTDVTLEIARRQFNDEGVLEWQELLNFVFDICINNDNESLRIIGLHIFSGIPNLLLSNTEAHFNLIGTTLNKCLSKINENGTNQSIEVREAGLQALCSFVVQEFEDNQNVTQLRSLIPLLLQTINDSIQENPLEDAVMKSFVELIDDAPGFLKNSVSSILELCISILQNEDIEEIQKHLAVEVFVSLSESCTNAVRKAQGATHTILQYLFKMLTEIEDNANWANIDEEEIDDDNSNHITAEIALDRLANAMRGKRLLEEIKQTVPLMLASNDWKQRHGGLKAISSMGEGLQKVMSEILGSILSEVVKLLTDSHPRVRYAACVCIGQMSTDFEPKLQTLHHEQVMPALMSVLNDDNNPRVQAYACSALTNFCEGAKKDILSLYLSELAEKLLALLKNKCQSLVQERKKMVLEQVVTTVAAVSDTAAERFEPFYSEFITIMKWIMENCNVDDMKLLRGKSIECISLMGLAVGKDKFLRDAHEVMNMLMTTQASVSSTDSSEINSDDPQHSYMISAWARICKLMGKDFAPYLQYVMGPVLKTASMKPETCFMYDEETTDMDKEHWQVVKVGQDQNVAINTSGIEEKINACQMLICYARELKEEFAPYVIEVANIMLPLLKFYLNDDVRSAAADIIPFLIDSSITMDEVARQQLWQQMIEALLCALKCEEEKIQQSDMLAAIGDGIEKMGGITQESLTAIIELMSKFFEELFKNQEARLAKRKADDYDDEEEENLEADKEDDDQILAKLVGLTHAIFKVYGKEAMSFFQQISGYVIRLLEPHRPYTDLQYGLCFLDDIMEYTGVDSFQYCQNFLPIFRSALAHQMPEVKQAAAYGVGLMAMYGGPQYIAFIQEVGLSMAQTLSTNDARSIDNNLASENFISALTKICKYQPTCVPGGDLDGFLSVWITWLPIYEDDEETQHVYGFVCDLIEAHNPVMLAPDNVVRIIKSIATCINKEVLPIEHEIYGRCLRLVKLVESNTHMFDQCIQNLSDDEKISLKKALENASGIVA